MKTERTTLVLGAVLVIVAGLFTASVTGFVSLQPNSLANTLGTGAYMAGHVTTIVTDADGNVKAYRQSDNVIVNNGENCVARLLFHNDSSVAGQGTDSGGISGCTGILAQPFSVIAVGAGSVNANGTDTGLGNEHPASGLQRLAGTVAFTESTGTGASTTAIAEIEALFTNSAGISKTVTESGLFNSTSVNATGLFARQTFPSITLNNGDSLTVQWTINVGGTVNALTQP